MTKLTKQQQKALTDFANDLRVPPYGESYVKLVAEHLNKRALDVDITLTEYGIMKDEPEQQAKWREAVRFIALTNGLAGHDYLPGKRIRDIKENPIFSFKIDTVVVMKGTNQ